MGGSELPTVTFCYGLPTRVVSSEEADVVVLEAPFFVVVEASVTDLFARLRMFMKVDTIGL